MEFKIKELNKEICFVYGFGKSKRIYKLVLTLERGKEISTIHALLSKKLLMPKDFLNLWKTILKASATEYFEMEVLPEHSRIYQKLLDIESIKYTKTFDNFESHTLIINRNAKINFFKNG